MIETVSPYEIICTCGNPIPIYAIEGILSCSRCERDMAKVVKQDGTFVLMDPNEDETRPDPVTQKRIDVISGQINAACILIDESRRELVDIADQEVIDNVREAQLAVRRLLRSVGFVPVKRGHEATVRTEDD